MTTVSPEQATNAASEPSADSQESGNLPSLESTPLEAIEGHLYGDKPISFGEPEAPKEPVPPEAPEAPKEPEPPKEPEAPEPPKEPVPPEPEGKILPNRITTKQFNDVEQEAIALGKALKDAGEEVPSLKERIEIIERRHSEAAKPAPAPEPAKPRESERLGTELAEIDAQLEKFGTEEQVMSPDVVKLIQKRSDIAAELALARSADKAEAGKVQSKSESTRTEALQESYDTYPSLADKTSPLARMVAERVSELTDPTHPDHGTLFTAEAPLTIVNRQATNLARKIATEKSIPFAEALASLLRPPAPKTVAQPAKEDTTKEQIVTRKVQPASGAATTAEPAPAPTPEERLGDPNSYDPKSGDQFMAEKSGRPRRYILGANG